MADYKVVRVRNDSLQRLLKRTVLGWVEVDREVIPEHVMITLGCFGDVGDWKSKFSKIIDLQQEKGYVNSDEVLLDGILV